MADNTNRFGLNTYSQGDTNWDHTDTVQTIDELAIERDTIANRPASGDYDDELYLATDQQILYRWDETETDWIVEGVGSETDPLPKVWANEIDANSVNTEDATIGGIGSHIHWEHIATLETAEENSVSQSVSGFDHYRVEYFLDIDSDDETNNAFMRLNNDDESEYTYFNESGEKFENQNEFKIFETNTGSTQMVGVIELRQRFKTGIIHNVGGGRTGALVSWGQAGHYDGISGISDIEVFTDSEFITSSDEVIIYGGNKP